MAKRCPLGAKDNLPFKNRFKFDDAGNDFEQLLLILELMCHVNYSFDSLHKLIDNKGAYGILA